MSLDSEHARAPLRPQDPHSSPLSDRKQNHKRQRSHTLGTTFVSTTVVPASSSEVLSSLISSLTLLSDSAREKIRNARETEQTSPELPPEHPYRACNPLLDVDSQISILTEQQNEKIDDSDGDEAEPPVIGYARSRPKEQRTSTARDRWMMHGPGKDKQLNLSRTGSSYTLQRPVSGASSTVGLPSIERGLGGSTPNLPVSPSPGALSPLKMLFSNRQEADSNYFAVNPSRDVEAKSMKSYKTSRSRQSSTLPQEPERDDCAVTSVAYAEEQQVLRPVERSVPEHKAYSPLSPSNREDLSEHLIPSRRSSMRHSPSLRGSSKGRSPSAGRNSSLRSKSFSAVSPEISKADLGEEPFDEDEPTLRRIRELQQAKEKRHSEWRKESKRSERAKKSPRNRHKPAEQNLPDRNESTNSITMEQIEYVPYKHSSDFDKLEAEAVSTQVVREISTSSPLPGTAQDMPSPALSTPRKHKRSLSAGLRRSNSSKHRPIDDLRTVSEQVEAFLTAPRLTQRIRHPRTGRTIAFSEAGDPNGFVVICCVGMGLTRFVTSFYDEVARTQKLRLITPDRPGIGESSPFPENVCTPLAWVDDVAVICQTLNIEKFSLLAHSAGSIYALATALKMPDRVRGRIHLLAPWIPPSQFPNGASSGEMKVANLPIAHRFLSVLPTPFLRAANSRFLSATSASIDSRSSKGRKKDKSIASTYDTLLAEMTAEMQPSPFASSDALSVRLSSLSYYANTPASTPPPYSPNSGLVSPPMSPSPSNMKRQFSTATRKYRSPTPNEGSMGLTPQAKQALFNTELTHRTWALATLNANPSVDLLVCLERRRPIGFQYTDVTRGVVIHHGRDDARVPLDNVQWLSSVMKRCELRILNNEGHGLMASADVMSRVLSEIGREWEEWDVIARDQERQRKDQEMENEKIKAMERRRFIRQGR